MLDIINKSIVAQPYTCLQSTHEIPCLEAPSEAVRTAGLRHAADAVMDTMVAAFHSNQDMSGILAVRAVWAVADRCTMVYSSSNMPVQEVGQCTPPRSLLSYLLL